MDLEKIFKKKKILITGHTGFKGSWLTLFLLKYNANILGISDKLLKYPNNFETINIPKIQQFKQIVNETGSDSSALDNMLEILVSGGINILKSIRMIIPPAWQNAQLIDPDVRSFHEYNSMHMEPWDGPAGIVMSDGKWAICVLDRNGLRPARYQIDNLNNITIASETGVNPVHDENIKSKGRISPGGLLAINTENSEILSGEDVDNALKNGATYRRWLKDNAI